MYVWNRLSNTQAPFEYMCGTVYQTHRNRLNVCVKLLSNTHTPFEYICGTVYQTHVNRLNVCVEPFVKLIVEID
jgi:hypothetical protein